MYLSLFKTKLYYMKAIIKSPEKVWLIRESGKYLTELLHELYAFIKPWISLIEIENYAQRYITMNGVEGAFKWYQWFPANLCLSVNDCVVHWIPDGYVLKTWDHLKVDCGIIYQWAISDAAFSIVVWWDAANPAWANLIKVNKKALDDALKFVGPWNSFYPYSQSVFNTVSKAGYRVIKYLWSHGVGDKVHEAPSIFNRPAQENKRAIAQAGMVVALEPIISFKSTDFYEKPGNNWNIYTQNGDLWSQWEYTVAITDSGYEILAGITQLK